MSKNLYLKQNIQVEPLINLWYAWTYLISPATAAMVITNTQMQIMNSYIQSPEIHESALKNDALLGGPFIDLKTRQLDEIKKLKELIQDQCAGSLILATAIKSLVTLLEKADGHSLESFYNQVPEALQGYVELVYDLNNRADFRLIESLLYASNYNLKNQQSMLLTAINVDHRPFAFSTPRLPRQDQVHIKLPFCNTWYDELFALKDAPKSAKAITQLLSCTPNKQEIDESLFFSFFTEEAPHIEINNSIVDNVRIRYFGHACVLIESSNCTILVDPVISYQYPSNIDRYTYADLPTTIDYLLITHCHLDHVLIEHLLQLRHKVKNVIVPKNAGGFLQDPSLKLFFKSLGFRNVIEIDDMESIEVLGGSITGIPFFGEHGDINIQTKKAYYIKQHGKTILCAADSNNIEPMLYEHVYSIIGNIDVIFIGMECDGAPLSWVYGSLLPKKLPRSMDQSRRLDGSNYEKAYKLVERFQCKHVYVYAMGQEPWLNYVMCIKYTPLSKPIVESDKLVTVCKEKGIISERLFAKKEIFI